MLNHSVCSRILSRIPSLLSEGFSGSSSKIGTLYSQYHYCLHLYIATASHSATTASTFNNLQLHCHSKPQCHYCLKTSTIYTVTANHNTTTAYIFNNLHCHCMPHYSCLGLPQMYNYNVNTDINERSTFISNCTSP